MALQTTTPRTRRSSTKPTRTPRSDANASLIDPDRRRALIAQAAYLRAECRGFEPGHEVEDWLAAEAEVDTALTINAAASDN